MNKYLLVDKSKLLKSKLDRLAVKLQGSIKSTEFITKEEILFEAIRIISEFYKDLNEPRMELHDVHQDDLPDVEIYNKIFQQLLDDLTIIFTELENIESLTVANFNFVTTEANRLTARLKAVSSKLGDYILYSTNPLKDAFFFKDSFNDLSKIHHGSSLLNADECEVGQTEGIVTLPIDKTKDSTILVKEAPIINPSSNGVDGNNQELGVQWRGDTVALLDNNPDSWFEYERVVTIASDDKEPLILDITLNLGEAKVINHIRVNPNNFGTKTIINIDTIETSVDGKTYTSIKDDIPIAGFVTQDEENIFQLAPSTSKYAGQGIYSFTPRKVKYIHFVFRQTEPYIISTSTGDKLRYAIGLRDLEVKAFTYKPLGEIISTKFESQSEIRKVLLQSNQNPSQASELASIQWFVSPNDGASWYEIQPKEFGATSGVKSVVPEILEFNGITSGSIRTAVAVDTLRVKAILKRVDDNFEEGSSSLSKQVATTSEPHSVPDAAPFTLDLSHPPVDGTVIVIDPLFGSRGMPESPYILGHTTDRLNLRKYRLPFKNLPRPMQKVAEGLSPIEKYYVKPMSASDWLHIEVGGTEWEHATDTLDTYGETDKVFSFNVNNGEIEFGDGTNGQAPEENEPIVTWFDAERIFPSEAEDDHVAKLAFATSANKDDMTIKRYDKIVQAVDILPRRATVLRLKHQFITDDTDIISKMNAAGYDANPVDFLNGKDELPASGNWSIDPDEGIIYTNNPTPDNSNISVSYLYQPIYTLSKDDWEWATDALLRDAVSIKDSAWRTISVEEEDVYMSNGMTVIDLAHMSVVKDTIIFDLASGVAELPDDEHPFQKEVAFRDGITELGGSVAQTTENIASHSGGGVQSYTFTEIVVSDTNLIVTFEKTAYFSTEKSWGACVANGDYAINRSTNQYQFYSTSAITTPGKVTYFYTNPNFSNNGLYSVDYHLGRIYTQIPMQNAFGLKVSYEYTDFRAEYRIARMLNENSYDVDITNQSVTIKDSEILKHMMIPHGRMDSRTPYYLVNYDYVAETREEIAELKDYFSPVIKDYALKVLVKGKVY